MWYINEQVHLCTGHVFVFSVAFKSGVGFERRLVCFELLVSSEEAFDRSYLSYCSFAVYCCITFF